MMTLQQLVPIAVAFDGAIDQVISAAETVGRMPRATGSGCAAAVAGVAQQQQCKSKQQQQQQQSSCWGA